jgi:hypothetical protein
MLDAREILVFFASCFGASDEEDGQSRFTWLWIADMAGGNQTIEVGKLIERMTRRLIFPQLMSAMTRW